MSLCAVDLPKYWPKRVQEADKEIRDVQADVKESSSIIASIITVMSSVLGLPTPEDELDLQQEDEETVKTWLVDWSAIANPLLELFHYVELTAEVPRELLRFLERVLEVAQSLEDRGTAVGFEKGRHLHLHLMQIPSTWRTAYPLLKRWKMQTPSTPFDIETNYGFLELFRRVGGEASIVSVTWDKRIQILHTHVWQSMLKLHGPPPRLDVSTKEEAEDFVRNAGRIFALLNKSAKAWDIGNIGGILKAMMLQHALYCRDTTWMYGIRIEDTLVRYGAIPEDLRHYVLGRQPFLWEKLLEANPRLPRRTTWFGENPLRKDFLQAALATHYANELVATVHTTGEWSNGDPRSIKWYLESACDPWVDPPSEIIELLNQFLVDMAALLKLMPDVILIPIPGEYLPWTKLPAMLLGKHFGPLEGLSRRPAKEDIDCKEALLMEGDWIGKFKKQRGWILGQPTEPAALRTAATTVAIFYATYNAAALQSTSDELRQAVVELLDLLETSINSTDTALWKYMPDPANIPPGWRGMVSSLRDVNSYVQQETGMINDVLQKHSEAIYGMRYGISVSTMFDNMTLQETRGTIPTTAFIEARDLNDQASAMEVERPDEATVHDPTEESGVQSPSMLEEQLDDDNQGPSNPQTNTITIETLKSRGKGKQKRAQRRRKTQPKPIVPTGIRQVWDVLDDPRREHYSFYTAGVFTTFVLLSLNRVHSDDILPTWHEGAGEWAQHDINPKPTLEIELTMVLAQLVGFLWLTLKDGTRIILASIELCTSGMPEEYVAKKDLPNKGSMYEAIGPRLGLTGRPPFSQAEKKSLAAKGALEIIERGGRQ
ncbi:hypothetical protein CALCODRAFT_510288 [Calocera cornea HHB12733]|uniref:Uncharacterized protein n=1 Tax=Calocera cornea HHB12733 TaxID=1353952 RepID=A0A165EM62_9BASI|nr:hypothetical protein CALCODRAFT_510288 [Calocera cornea HHB12733]